MDSKISTKDVDAFKKAVSDLNSVICRIVEYEPDARLFITPGSVQLMATMALDDRDADAGNIVADEPLRWMDVGDW